MDELTNQLRKLGEATQAQVDPVTADEVGRGTPTAVNDIGVAGRAPQSRADALSPALPRRRLSPKVLAAAAALVLLVAATVVLSSANDNPTDLASAIQPPEFAVPTDDNGWEALRQCESKGDYGAETGNTFYGAYQFTRSDFRELADELGLTDYVGTIPAQTPPEIQDVIANALYLRDGADAWPVCGRYIEGPMVTPVVPEWSRYATEAPDLVAVFINPTVGDDRMAEIAEEITQIIETTTTASSSSRAVHFVDQAEAFGEFQEMFADEDESLLPIGSADVPARFEIGLALSDEGQQRLRDIAGVFEVVVAVSPFAAQETLPMRLAIPVLGLASPVYPSSSIDQLARGPVVLVDTPSGLVIGGHGSLEGSVFGQLDQLRDGDEIIVTSLLVDPGASIELVRRFEVDLGSKAEPPSYDIDDMLLWRRYFQTQTLTLVADDPGDASRRIVVRTKASGPNLRGYPVDSEE